MSRHEFIDGLRRALAGKVEPEIIDENVRYYEDYIDTQIRGGLSEESVLETLGKPAFLAKSIVNAARSGRGNGDRAETIYDENDNDNSSRFSRSWLGDKGVRLIMNMPGWLAICLAALVLFAVIGLLFSILSALAPVLIPLLVILVVIHFVRRSNG